MDNQYTYSNAKLEDTALSLEDLQRLIIDLPQVEPMMLVVSKKDYRILQRTATLANPETNPFKFGIEIRVKRWQRKPKLVKMPTYKFKLYN